jgi:sortase A
VGDYPISSRAPARGSSLPRRRRSRRSRAARWLAVLMILAGTLALADGVVTLLWQEPISALIAKLRQDRLSGDLRHVEQARPSFAERHALAGIADQRRRIVYLAHSLERETGNGGPVGRIVIPRIGTSFVVVKGTDTSDLESGPGIYSDTSFPGGAGTTAIAGHRTTYLAPFRHIDALAPGNTIRLNMPYAHFTYTVVGHRVVSPYDVHAAVGSVGYSRLVLSACTPLFSAAKRLLVFARLTRIVPVGAARPMLGGELSRPIELPLRRPRPRRLPPVLESLGPYYVAPVS